MTHQENEDDLKCIAASGKASVTPLTVQQRDA